MLKIVALLVIVLNINNVSACAISARSAVLIDGTSGRVLYEHNAYEQLPMASTTKIMTGLLACESGKLEETVKASAFASGTEGSSLWLKIGEKQTLKDLTYGLMLKSGNDAAVAIAEYLGGSTEAFALIMNKRAREIGAVNTSFKNPHGLDTDDHYTTSFDLALIAKEAMKNDKFREIVSTKTYSIPMEGEKWDRALKNHNKLLWQYDGCNGVKTGFTKKCGRCLVSSAEKSGQRLICVTLNAPDDWNDHKYLLDYGFENFHAETVVKKEEPVKTVTYNKKYKKRAVIVAKEDCAISLKENDKITTEISVDKIKAPMKKNSTVGKMTVYCNGEKINDIELVTAEDLKEVTVKERIMYYLKKLLP